MSLLVESPNSPVEKLFSVVVVGVDDGRASLHAVRQALRLAAPGAPVELLAVVHLAEAALVGWNPPRIADALERSAGDALRRAEAVAGDRATSRLVDGPVVRTLLDEIDRRSATLVAVGSHGHARRSGIVLGGVSTTLVHEAPCAVLVARPCVDEARFPHAIVVGVDGSPPGNEALAVASALSATYRAPLRPIVARGGKDVAVAAARRACPEVEVVEDSPVDALLDAAETADLVVVGSRGLHGVRALGSVSERVAHGARSSVLVVRSRPTR